MGQVLPLLELQSEDGVEYSRETKTAITAKLAICRICVFVLECRLEKRLSIAFDMYSRLFESQVGQVSESKTPLVTLGGADFGIGFLCWGFSGSSDQHTSRV